MCSIDDIMPGLEEMERSHHSNATRKIKNTSSQDPGYGDDSLPSLYGVVDDDSAPLPVNRLSLDSAPIRPTKRASVFISFDDVDASDYSDSGSDYSASDDEEEEPEDNIVDLGYGETKTLPNTMNLGYGEETPEVDDDASDYSDSNSDYSPSDDDEEEELPQDNGKCLEYGENKTLPISEDLGYGEEPVSKSMDLGYGEEKPEVDLGYAADTPAPTARARFAAPIRPDKRGSVANRNLLSIYGGDMDMDSDYCPSDSDYSESDSEDEDDKFPCEDGADMVHATLDHLGSFHDLRGSGKSRMPSGHVSVEYGQEAGTTMPARVDLQYGDEPGDLPRRISLRFNQSTHGGSFSDRSGRLDVSIGTSNGLKRSGASIEDLGTPRRATLDHYNASFSNRPGRRITMDTSATFSQRPGRRITMDTSATSVTPRQQQAMRRTTMDHSSPAQVQRRITRNTSSRPMRRTTMDHVAAPQPERRGLTPTCSIHPSCHSTTCTGAATPRQQQVMRRTTMDHNRPAQVERHITRNASSRPMRRTTMDHVAAPQPERRGLARTCSIHPSCRSTTCTGITTPRQQQAMRRTTMDHNRPAQVERHITRNTSSRPMRRTTMDHAAAPQPERRGLAQTTSLHPACRNTMDSIARGVTPRQQQAMRRTTMDHNRPTQVEPCITRNTPSRPMRRTTMDHTTPSHTAPSATTTCPLQAMATGVNNRPCGGALRRVTMDVSSKTSSFAAAPRNARPASRRMLPRRNLSSRAA